jgi:hypothetical protein
LVPTQYNNNIFIRGNEKHKPFIDDNVNIYYLEKGFIDTTITSKGSNIDNLNKTQIKNSTIITKNSDIGDTWTKQKIKYKTYIEDLEKYSGYDIYVGKGSIEKVTIINGTPIDPPEYTVIGGDLDILDSGSIGTCNDYPLNSVCPINDPKKKETCEICKNFKYRDWYDANNPTEISRNARYDDATSEYVHTWLQTWNLGIGIMVLAYGIYYQLS